MHIRKHIIYLKYNIHNLQVDTVQMCTFEDTNLVNLKVKQNADIFFFKARDNIPINEKVILTIWEQDSFPQTAITH